MPSAIARLTREVYRREKLPARARWWLAAAGMLDFFRVMRSKLRPHLGDRSDACWAALGSRMFRRRYEALREKHPDWPSPEADPRALALAIAGLYRTWTAPKMAWIFDGIGGAPRGPREHLASQMRIRSLSAEARWQEVTVHLGELLIVLTEDLPAHMPHARKVLGDICFEMGAKYAERMRRFFGLSDEASAAEQGSKPQMASQAIEVLRMSEYVFRVNPEHWHGTDAATKTGYLEGTACPWFMRPGWHQAHCGIFGQFQAGIASVFGLRYLLSKTIPKHGGETCRIDLKPISLRRKEAVAP